ncbi:unnamed protein product [Periconia digitata]|uniref:Uncharacterized protein n=1 Tax=Periconia digitata TaxID=1303443 RepID=A0A9W4UHJ1_9PLEO|nr:unnamed protein product [Periconia digitata]
MGVEAGRAGPGTYEYLCSWLAIGRSLVAGTASEPLVTASLQGKIGKDAGVELRVHLTALFLASVPTITASVCRSSCASGTKHAHQATSPQRCYDDPRHGSRQRTRSLHRRTMNSPRYRFVGRRV